MTKKILADAGGSGIALLARSRLFDPRWPPCCLILSASHGGGGGSIAFRSAVADSAEPNCIRLANLSLP